MIISLPATPEKILTALAERGNPVCAGENKERERR
jgi:hypothetical protein